MLKSRRRKRYEELAPDEIFLDSRNLPEFNQQQFEGRLERPIRRTTFYWLGAFFALIGMLFLGQIVRLQIVNGSEYADRSANNTLRHTPVYAERGLIYDRRGEMLAWNNGARFYIDKAGFAHLLGYLGFPTDQELKDEKYDPKQMIGKDGVESFYEEKLGGEKGIKIEEINALGEIVDNNILRPPKNGDNLTLSIDARVQAKLHEYIRQTAIDRGFSGGSGALMDIYTGELIALTSYPEFSPNTLTTSRDKEKLASYFSDKRNPFLNRMVSGLYTPGSVFKPFMAIGALTEGTIDPKKQILSTGQLVVPNPYNPKLKTVFKDWREQGWVDMRLGIAYSSNVYFYVLGGGFGSQKGIGIANIIKYAEMFGLSKNTGIDLPGEAGGLISSPEWKEKTFNEPWRIGDTYHTVIGQYGTQVTPIQILRAVASIANGGRLVQPTVVLKSATSSPALVTLPISEKNFQIIREGMRLAVTDPRGSAKSLNDPNVKIAAKTGTAELGDTRATVNSWVMGYFPYEHPRYVFVVVMEKGSRQNLVGATYVIRQLVDWLAIYSPEYLRGEAPSLKKQPVAE